MLIVVISSTLPCRVMGTRTFFCTTTCTRDADILEQKNVGGVHFFDELYFGSSPKEDDR